jgi:YD repeat-containing protein
VAFRVDGKIRNEDYNNANGSISHLSYLYDGEGRLAEIQFRTNDLAVHRTLYSYDEAGRHVRTVEVNPDGSQRGSEACYYKGDGRKKKVRLLDPKMANVACMYGVEGSEQAYSAPGAATMTTVYDENNRPTEVLFHDGTNQLHQRLTVTRDDAGRVVTEEMRVVAQAPFPGLDEELESSSPEDRASVDALLGKLFGSGDAFSKTTYVYDDKGRVLERNTSMLNLHGDRTTFRYDEHDNPIEHTSEHSTQQNDIDEQGQVRTAAQDSHTEHFRFQYRYDEFANWTERVVWVRGEPNGDLQRSNVERREITYWDPSAVIQTE